MLSRRRSPFLRTASAAAVTALALAGCGPDDVDAAMSALGNTSVTIASFDFAESEVLASLYARVLEMNGIDVELELGLGPRELLLPALAGGLIEMVPEYAGTALQFISVGAVVPAADPTTTHNALVDALSIDDRVTALTPSPAQDSNTIVVTEDTAARYGLVTISDLRPVAGQLTFGGPPECPTRPFCLLGLHDRYGLEFNEFLALDAGGPMTRRALRQGHVDVALLFSTDASIGRGGFVELVDDLSLQPAENVTPLVHRDVLATWGAALTDVVGDVSRRLSTEELRGLNLRVLGGDSVAEAVDFWLRSEGIT